MVRNRKKPLRQIELVEVTRRRRPPAPPSAERSHVRSQRNDSYHSYEVGVPVPRDAADTDEIEVSESDILELHDLAAEAGTRT